MKVSWLLYLPFLFLLSCKGDDNEPMPEASVSRLYVSNADTDAGIPNTIVFDRADASPLPSPYSFDSKLPEAAGIFFDPYSGTVFQVSRRNRNIKTFDVNTDGTLRDASSFIDEALLSPRAVAYDRNNRLLYVASDLDSALYVYREALTKNGTVVADKKLKLNGRPWDLQLIDDRLFVVMDDRPEVQLYEKASALVVGTILPDRVMRITGVSKLRGIALSASLDAVVLANTNAPASNTGSVIVIESAAQKFAHRDSVQAVAATRTISGLVNPSDLAWDEEAGLIYVADKAARQIRVFNFQDQGAAVPRIANLNSSPEAIFLDVR